MREVIILISATGLMLLACGLALLLGIIRGSNLFKITSLICFVVFICLAALTTYRFVNKSYNKVANALKPRTGEEIYDALFGKRQSDCVKVLGAQDQVIPKIDYAIWLHFKTCPNELKRILSRHKFSKNTFSIKQKNINMPYEKIGEWFDPVVLGDSVLVYEYSSKDNRNIQTLWVSIDSAEVFCRDIFD